MVPGAYVTFTITADPGYHVADVLVDGVSVGARTSYAFTNVQADHTISATFAADAGHTYTITPSAGAHGGISPPMPQSVAAGESVLFTITAETGYHVADVLVDGASVGARSSYQFTNVQADHTLSASFAADAGPTVTVTSPRGAVGWRRGTSQTVRWRVFEPVAVGIFRVWAESVKGTRYRVTAASAPVKAVAGAASYSARWKVNAPPGTGYRIVVEHSWAGTKLAVGRSTGRLTITR